MSLLESSFDPAQAVYDFTLPAGDPWLYEVKKGQTLRILDLEGNQAADTLFFNAHDPAERYSAQDTIREQASIYLTAGTRLMSNEGRALMTIVADTCGRHDTLGGACSQESNMVRYAIEKYEMHACRNSFLKAALLWSAKDRPSDSPEDSLTFAGGSVLHGLQNGRMDKRDIAHNVNFFMNVPVTPEGKLTFEDGVSAPGKYVEMRAEMDVLVMISNCPQLNNPCNAYNPTPVRLLIWN